MLCPEASRKRMALTCATLSGWLFVIFFALAGTRVLALPPQPEADALMLAATEAMEAGDWAKAAESFDGARKISGAKLPSSFEFHRGRALMGASRFREAREAFDTYVTFQGEKARFYQDALKLHNEAGAKIAEAERLVAAAAARKAAAEQAARAEAARRLKEQELLEEGIRFLEGSWGDNTPDCTTSNHVRKVLHRGGHITFQVFTRNGTLLTGGRIFSISRRDDQIRYQVEGATWPTGPNGPVSAANGNQTIKLLTNSSYQVWESIINDIPRITNGAPPLIWHRCQ